MSAGASLPSATYRDSNVEVCANGCEWVNETATAVTLPSSFGNLSSTIIDIDGVHTQILLDRFVGAAHAYCFSLTVVEDPQLDFRMCTTEEVSALSAVIPFPRGNVVSHSSSDGDDIDSGAIKFARSLTG